MDKRFYIIIIALIIFSITSFKMCGQNDSLAQIELAAFATFMNKAAADETRISAIKTIGYPTNEMFSSILENAKDPSETPELRLEAFKVHQFDEAYFNTALSTIDDNTEPPFLVQGLIKDIGRRTTFRLPTELRQQLQATLRNQLEHPNEDVRLAAYYVLVGGHDITAVDKLVESLRNNQNIPIPLEEAIRLLDVDGATKHIGTIRPYLTHPNKDVRAAAARALSVDEQSRGDIRNMTNNREETIAVRTNAMRGLAREDQELMEDLIDLMLNSQESADIRYEAMENGMRRLNYQNEPAGNQIRFGQAVERLTQSNGGTTSDGKNITAEAKRLLVHLRANFPAIGRFYKLRGN